MLAEEWKDYYGYKVSNYGKIVNRFGKVVCGQKHTFNGYSYWQFVLRIDKKRKCVPANTLIYSLFGSGYVKGMKIYYIDGNYQNNCIENLYVCKTYTRERTAEQIKIFEQQAIPCVKSLVYHYGYLEFLNKGYDIDNVIGESLSLIWKYLASYENGIKFLTFCKKYVRYAFLQEHKYRKHYVLTISDNQQFA